jgi:hypothetical protein
MSTAATLHRVATRQATGTGGTWRGWSRWLWRQLVATGAARYRARVARSHWRY